MRKASFEGRCPRNVLLGWHQPFIIIFLHIEDYRRETLIYAAIRMQDYTLLDFIWLAI